MKQELIYQGKIIRLLRETLQLGGRRIVREVVVHPGAAVIVPMLDRPETPRVAKLARYPGLSPGNRSVISQGRCVVMVRQYRRPAKRWLLELPAGTLSPGEAPVRCARRELEEETGWRARHFRRISGFYAAPGLFSEWMTVFLATGLTPVPARPEPDELLTPVIVPLRTALAKIRSGAICDAKSIIGLLVAQELLRARQQRGNSLD